MLTDIYIHFLSYIYYSSEIANHLLILIYENWLNIQFDRRIMMILK